MNIRDLIIYGKSLLKTHTASYALDAELLLCHVLGVEKQYIIIHDDELIAEKSVAIFKALIAERIQRKPIAYITNKKYFWNEEFDVLEGVLIPRSDTETIIEMCSEIFINNRKQMKIADFGAGTGCIIITLLLIYRYAIGYAYDKSNIACCNVYRNKKKFDIQNLTIINKSWETATGPFDVIISNPPYISNYDMAYNTDRHVYEYEPHLALRGGNGGFKCYFSIFRTAKNTLKKNGYLLLEIGYGQSGYVKKIACEYGMKFIKSTKDINRIIRCLVFKNM